MIWHTIQGVDLGFLPAFLDDADPRPAKEQFNENYKHGGGWRKFEGFTLHKDNSISYPDDPPLYPIAWTKLRDEAIFVYQSSWVLVRQPDGSHEIARID